MKINRLFRKEQTPEWSQIFWGTLNALDNGYRVLREKKHRDLTIFYLDKMRVPG